MSERILILGGTTEAIELAADLIAKGHDITTSLAGRTNEPARPDGKIRIGGFGGVEGLSRWIKEQKIDRVIDATHPFAQRISNNAILACEKTGTPLSQNKRVPWKTQTGDIWTEVSNLTEALNAIPEEANVFLALGSQHIDLFAERTDVHFTIRMVDSPKTLPKFVKHTLILGKPALKWQEEAALLRKHAITHIVCRNSGGKGAYAKIRAARELAIPVILVTMPS